VFSLSLLLLLSGASGSALAVGWPIPSSPGAVLQNLDRTPARLDSGEGGAASAAARSALDITIIVRSRVEVTVICRARGQLFNHDLPAGRPDPERAGAQCAQVVGEKGSERIEDTGNRDRKNGRKKGRVER
jgi:hypothetical protein